MPSPHRRLPPALPLAAAAVVLVLVASAQDTPAPSHPPTLAPSDLRITTTGGFAKVRTLVKQYCSECHGPKDPEGDLNLMKYRDEDSILRDPKPWKKAWSMLNTREMPPDDAPRPTPEERDRMVEWLESTLTRPVPGAAPDPGRVVLRRLSRYEYRCTIRDLVGVDYQPSADFPADDVGYGFDNIGDVLSLPPLLMEKYLAAAAAIVDAAIVTPDEALPRTRTIQAEGMESEGGSHPDNELRVLFTSGRFYSDVDFDRPGRYRLRVRAAADLAGPEPPRMDLRVSEREVKTFDVTAPRSKPKTYEATFETDKPGKRRVSVAFLNDYWNENAPNPADRDRNLAVDWVEIHGPLPDPSAPLPESHRRLLPVRPDADPPKPGEATAKAGAKAGEKKPKRDAARECLAAFLPRAFRRPVPGPEVDRYLKLFDEADKAGESFEAAMQIPLQAALVSPNFLFRVETDKTVITAGSAAPDAPAPAAKDAPLDTLNRDDRRSAPVISGSGQVEKLDDWALASRLSYFLWSSLPDDELSALARKGTLRNPGTLDQQVARMLKDPKARALADNFAVQWLQIRRLEQLVPDPKRFPAFNERLKQAMVLEVVLFFEAILREDRSVLELITTNFTFLNEELARHYGLPGVKGPEMRRVDLTDRRRGGVPTMGAVLTATSNPTRTNPPKRGKWVLETMLGKPPPPPLPNAPDLKAPPAGSGPVSLRVRLERHRADPMCASCHQRMDPLGFAFENFDATGAWRATDEGLPIDAAGEMPDGTALAGPVELKTYLLANKEDFVRCLTEKLMTYALGRGLEMEDARHVREIARALAKSDHRFSALIAGVVRSYPFQNRRRTAK